MDELPPDKVAITLFVPLAVAPVEYPFMYRVTDRATVAPADSVPVQICVTRSVNH